MRGECSSDLAGSDQQRTQVEVAIQWSQHRLPFSPAVDESHLSPAMTNCTTSTARPTGSRYARHKKRPTWIPASMYPVESLRRSARPDTKGQRPPGRLVTLRRDLAPSLVRRADTRR